MKGLCLLIGATLLLGAPSVGAHTPESPTADLGELLAPIPSAITSGKMAGLRSFLSKDVVIRETARNRIIEGRENASEFLHKWTGDLARNVKVMASRDEIVVVFDRLSPDYGSKNRPLIGYVFIFHCVDNEISEIDVIERDSQVEDDRNFFRQVES